MNKGRIYRREHCMALYQLWYAFENHSGDALEENESWEAILLVEHKVKEHQDTCEIVEYLKKRWNEMKWEKKINMVEIALEVWSVLHAKFMISDRADVWLAHDPSLYWPCCDNVFSRARCSIVLYRGKSREVCNGSISDFACKLNQSSTSGLRSYLR